MTGLKRFLTCCAASSEPRACCFAGATTRLHRRPRSSASARPGADHRRLGRRSQQHRHYQAGARFGYGMTWVMLFIWPLMAAIQEITRIGGSPAMASPPTARALPRWLLRAVQAVIGRQHHQPRRDGRRAAAADVGPKQGLRRRFRDIATLEISHAMSATWCSTVDPSLFAYVATVLVVAVPWGRLCIRWCPASGRKDYVVSLSRIRATLSPYCSSGKLGGGRGQRQSDEHPLTEAPGKRRPPGSRSTPMSGWAGEPDRARHHRHHRGDLHRTALPISDIGTGGAGAPIAGEFVFVFACASSAPAVGDPVLPGRRLRTTEQ